MLAEFTVESTFTRTVEWDAPSPVGVVVGVAVLVVVGLVVWFFVRRATRRKGPPPLPRR